MFQHGEGVMTDEAMEAEFERSSAVDRNSSDADLKILYRRATFLVDDLDRPVESGFHIASIQLSQKEPSDAVALRGSSTLDLIGHRFEGAFTFVPKPIPKRILEVEAPRMFGKTPLRVSAKLEVVANENADTDNEVNTLPLAFLGPSEKR